MALERNPFTSTRLEEDRAKDKFRVLSLKLSKDEDEALEEDMKLLDIGVDSACVKLLMRMGRKVLREQFGADDLKYLVSLKRTRFDGRKR